MPPQPFTKDEAGSLIDLHKRTMANYGILLPSAISTASPACRFRSPNTKQSFKKHHAHVSSACKAAAKGGDTNGGVVDRRGVLLGLTGTAAATTAGGVVLLPAQPSLAAAAVAASTTTGTGTSCNGKPIEIASEWFKCEKGKTCFPLGTGDIVDFVPPAADEPRRVRRPVHMADREYIAKYTEAIRLQRELPDDDPRSFKNQAAVHDAFCNGFYLYSYVDDDGSQKEGGFNVHFSWIFFPWHRMYIYFYERILGKLIGDDAFAMPFWNWDHPNGMSIPPIYNDPSSPLYDANREASHLNAIVDLAYDQSNDKTVLVDGDPTKRKAAINCNLATMFSQVAAEEVGSPEIFMGARYCAGTKPMRGGGGKMEMGAHTALHIWVGNHLNNAKGKDMGDLGTAGLDPLFYVHHANVDRMWHLWRHTFGNLDFADNEWLDSSFPFYDEEKRLVRVRVRDVVDASALRYTYEAVDIPWLRSFPKPSGKRLEKPSDVVPDAAAASSAGATAYPLSLEEAVRVVVERPALPRTAAASAAGKKRPPPPPPEVLVIEEIEFDHCKYAKFDVYVNMPLDEVADPCPEASEFLGSFVNLPHGHQKREIVKTALRLPLSRALEDLSSGEDDEVFITLVPRSPEVVTIGAAPQIEYLRRRPLPS